MKYLRYGSGRLFCFSPPVMIATFIIEVGLALYTIWRYKWSPLVRLAVLLFAGLATFQLAEYLVCQELGGDTQTWSRIGYVAITTLPPLGLHMLHVITKARRRALVGLAYLSGAVFIAFFALAPHALDGYACMGNYVIFEVAPGAGWLYGLYYYGWLATTLVLCWRYGRRAKSAKLRRAISGVAAGYAIFLIPATTVSLLKPETIVGMPSIMCGFAVLLAVIVAAVVLPAATAAQKGKA